MKKVMKKIYSLLGFNTPQLCCDIEA